MMDESTRSGPDANVMGKYRLIAELGHGGMAEVFLAVARGPAGFNKLVVIKQIRPQLAQDPEFLAMFLDEARLAARLSHPNVVQTNEVGEDAGRYFIAMEYLEGQPLNRVIHRASKDAGVPLGVHVRILVDVLSGLHHAHELTDFDGTPLGVVHRDVTPHNVFVTYDGLVKVVDFGIAKAMNSSAETRTGVLKGKVAYMAPEQARGERVDRRADLFSVGIMLWEAIVGHRLWKGLSDVAILHKLLSNEIPRPISIRPETPPELDAIVMKALAPDREARHATAAELKDDLEAFLEQSGERSGMRDVVRLLAQHFEEDRARIKAIIDAQLRDAKSIPTAEWRASGLPVIDTNPSLSGATGQRSAGQSGMYTPPSLPSAQPPGAASASPSGTSYTAANAATEVTPPPQPGRRSAAPVIAIGAIGLLAGIAWIATSMRHDPPVPAPAASSAAAQHEAAPAASVSIRIAVTPADAHLFLDDKPLAGNPFAGKLPRDKGEHTLRIEAEGFETRSRSIALDKDVDVELALERAAPADADTASAAPAAVHAPAGHAAGFGAAPQPDDMKRTAPKPKHTLDDNNPYAQ
jgi:serine/threonine-protein kinase